MTNQNDSALRLPSKALAAKTPLLEVADLHAWYGAAHILHGVSLSVGRGEVVASGPIATLGDSPLFAPQIARLFPGSGWLTADDALRGLGRE